MNAFIKFFVTASLFATSVLAFAQPCIPAPQIQGQPQRCWDGRLIGQGGLVIGQQVVPVYNQIPSGYPVGNANQCAGAAERIGRVIGANRGNDARNTENAGFLGYIFGNIFCPSNNAGQQGVLVERGQNLAPATVRRPSSCIVGGQDFGDIPEVSCLKILQSLSSRVQSDAPQARPRVVTGPYCTIARSRDGVKEEKQASNPNGSQQFCEDLPRRLRSGEVRWEDL